MKKEFKLQDPGEGVHEVEIIDVMVATGDEISEGQEVLAVESDKAAIELPSPYGGSVADIRVKEGDTVTVGDVLIIVDDGTQETDQDAAEPDTEETEETPEPEGTQDDAEPDSENAEGAPAKEDADSPDEQDNPDRTEDAPDNKPDPEAGADRDDDGQDEPQEQTPVRASPAARKLARENGIDLAGLEPSGADGQVTLADVRGATPEEGAKESEKPDSTRETDDFGPVERQRMSAIRAATSRAMTRAWTEIPHVTHEDAADITELERWRRQQTDEERLSLTPIVARAVVAVLKDHPRFNASFDSDAQEIVLKRYHNISVAIATDRGLVTPVLKDAAGKSARDLGRDLASLAAKARDQKLGKTDLAGGTFTITNVGALGGRGLAPLVNPPQTAILGLARARIEPVTTASIDQEGPIALEARMILPMALSFDHRVIDGADAAHFMNDLVALLSDPVSLALET